MLAIPSRSIPAAGNIWKRQAKGEIARPLGKSNSGLSFFRPSSRPYMDTECFELGARQENLRKAKVIATSASFRHPEARQCPFMLGIASTTIVSDRLAS